MDVGFYVRFHHVLFADGCNKVDFGEFATRMSFEFLSRNSLTVLVYVLRFIILNITYFFIILLIITFR